MQYVILFYTGLVCQEFIQVGNPWATSTLLVMWQVINCSKDKPAVIMKKQCFKQIMFLKHFEVTGILWSF